MKPLTTLSLSAAILLFFSDALHAQVKTKTFIDSIPSHLMPHRPFLRSVAITAPSEFYKMKQGTAINKETKGVFRFAVPRLTDINFFRDAALTEAGGISTYSLVVTSPEALNLSLQFSEFNLSPGSVLSIFTKNELTDSITAKENNENKIWTSRTYDGNTINIVLKVPTVEKRESVLKIGLMYIGYKEIKGRFGSPGASESCNINVVCPLGSGWEKERNSVALIQASGGYASGVMVMNACGTNTPYFLTAKHVLDQGGSPANWIFQFFYYSTNCNTNVGYREDIQFNGATVKASYAPSDFALLQFNQAPAANSGIYYAGWNKASDIPFNVVGIHHPNHDVIKISYSNTQVLRSAGNGYNPTTHWQVNWSQGITAVGSSGSPLFNASHRVVGQLHDGTSFCSVPQGADWYGSFDISWTGGGTNATRLKDWLDPSNSGAATTNTTNISSLIDLNMLSISGNSTLCTGSSTYSIPGLPAGSTVTWNSSPAGNVSFSCTNCSSTTLTKTGNGGVITVSATIIYCSFTKAIYKTIDVGKPAPTITVTLDCPDGIAYASNAPGASSFTWHLVDVATHQETINSNYGSTKIYHSLQGTHNIGAEYINSCGTSPGGVIYNVYCPGGGHFAVSPNPANNTITVSVSQAQSAETSNIFFDKISIYDLRGNLKMQKKYSSVKQTNLDVANLINGTYFIEINNGTYKERQQLIIQKQ